MSVSFWASIPSITWSIPWRLLMIFIPWNTVAAPVSALVSSGERFSDGGGIAHEFIVLTKPLKGCPDSFIQSL